MFSNDPHQLRVLHERRVLTGQPTGLKYVISINGQNVKPLDDRTSMSLVRVLCKDNTHYRSVHKYLVDTGYTDFYGLSSMLEKQFGEFPLIRVMLEELK